MKFGLYRVLFCYPIATRVKGNMENLMRIGLISSVSTAAD